MKDQTLVTYAGRHPEDQYGAINPPVYHVSTVLYPTLAAAGSANKKGMTYGRHGSPTTFALEEAICALEGGATTVITPSGLSGCTLAVLACVGAGDHILVTDSIYDPTRGFCDGMLKRMGVETTYYDPTIGAGIADLFKPNTRFIFTESPGSRTFEIQDIPAIVAAARAASSEIFVAIDNTWATPFFYKPLAHGVDLSIQAATKYIVGHSDAMLGTVTANKRTADKLRQAFRHIGLSTGPDDVYLGLRGLRTLATRLKQHETTGLTLAHWFQSRPEVERVLHPALPEDPGHVIWKRDFSGASGLFGVVLKDCSSQQLEAFIDHLEHFKIGYSWGGYESLVTVANINALRSATKWQAAGPTLRFHAGLEHPDDLIADLENGFARFNAS